jgi:hypothetical protein
MQVVLLAVSVVYFFLGATLEYTKHSDTILFVMILFYGILKTGVSLKSAHSLRLDWYLFPHHRSKGSVRQLS